VRERDILLDPLERPKAPRTAAVAMVAAALFASVVMPGVPAGLNIPLVALTVAVAVALARPVEMNPVPLLYAGVALILASMPLVRAADWVVTVDVLAAVGFAALAVGRAVDWQGIVRAPFGVIGRVAAAPRFIVEPLLPDPGVSRGLASVLRGAGLAGLLLLVFGTLFASADRAFAKLAGDLLVPNLSLVPARLVMFSATLLGSGALILSGRRYAGTAGGTEVAVPIMRLGRIEWITALAVLDLLFAGFVLVQITVLFGDHRYVLATEGVTYSEYARQGFFQLLIVGALTLAVIASAVRWARLESVRDSVLLRLLLGALSVLTLVVLASALQRLKLYEEAFGLTRLRLSAHAAILWMGGIFVLLLVAGALLRTHWLPRVTLAFTALSLLGFTLTNPEGVVAERNVERFQETGKLDLEYVRTLGPDAVPALAELPPGVRCWALVPVAGRLGLDRTDPLLAWNLSRSRAREVLRRVPPRGCDIGAVMPGRGIQWRSL
jgi:hypothetical protein